MKTNRFSVNPYIGQFIVFEGLDGSGKSVQARALVESLESDGHEVVLTYEPTDESSVSAEIRDVLTHKKTMSPLKLQALFSQDRREHLQKLVIPGLKEGKVVISDRYFFSTFAFGGIDVDLEKLFELNKGFIMPDLTFLLKVSADTCLSRIEGRSSRYDFFEEKTKMEEVWQNYEKLAKDYFPDNTHIIDGEREPEVIAQEICKIVREKINL